MANNPPAVITGAAASQFVSLPLDEPYWSEVGGASQSFRTWWTSFANWIELQILRCPDMTDTIKNRILFQQLGTEGKRIFATNPIMDVISTTSFRDFSKAVQDTFKEPCNEARTLHDLLTCHQGRTETVQEFVAAVRSLAGDAPYCSDCKKKTLAALFILGTNSPRLQEELLSSPTLDYDAILGRLLAEEAARRNSAHLQGSAATVHAVHQGRNPPKRAQPSFESSGSCSYCGSSSGHSRALCPARRAICNQCGLKGHYAAVCRRRQEQGSDEDDKPDASPPPGVKSYCR